MAVGTQSHSRSAGTLSRAALAAGVMIRAVPALASATAQAASYEIHTGRYGVKPPRAVPRLADRSL